MLPRLRERRTVDLAGLRIAGAFMLAGAVLLPVLPGPDGVPCPLRSLTGIPCPLCGMTTSVIAAVHAHPMAAAAATPVGLLAVLVAAALLLFPHRREATVPAWALPVLLMAMWMWQLARFA